MKQYGISISDAKGTKLEDAFAEYLNYQETIDGEANPQTKQEFVNEKIQAYCLRIYRKNEIRKASITANQAQL